MKGNEIHQIQPKSTRIWCKHFSCCDHILLQSNRNIVMVLVSCLVYPILTMVFTHVSYCTLIIVAYPYVRIHSALINTA